MNNFRKAILVSLGVATAFATTVASAARPDNLAGTTWSMQVNQAAEQLIINTQSGPGAPGASTCRVINGELGIAPPTIRIRGWYCPSTGRIHFLHKNLNNNTTVRVFTGTVSDVPADPLNTTWYMSGTMYVDDANFGDYGEYNFSATK